LVWRQDPGEWDRYWNGQGSKPPSSLHQAYALVAAFYRRFIIRRALTRFVARWFEPRARLLHAGCGSGQVDADVLAFADVTALDISMPALLFYGRANPGRGHRLGGSIFDLPHAAGTFDGIYNLGVMEHFSEAQVDMILNEFHRVLRPGGRVVLLWPPEFGLSVAALKVVNFILHRLMKKRTELFPPEINRLRSRKHAQQALSRADFALEQFYFGALDFFTHAIVVGTKR